MAIGTFDDLLPSTYNPQANPWSYSNLFKKGWEDLGYMTGTPTSTQAGFYLKKQPGGGWTSEAERTLPGTFIPQKVNEIETAFANAVYQKTGRFPTADEVNSYFSTVLNSPSLQNVISGKEGPSQFGSIWANPYIEGRADLFKPKDAVSPTTPTSPYTPVIPDQLGVNSILEQLNKPTKDIVSELLMAQAPIISKEVMKGVAPAQAAAQSGFMQRGLTGSSTELGTIFKDIPAQANEAIADALAKTFIEAYPIALQEKQLETGTTISLRKVLTDEQFNSMSLEQKQALATQDAELKMTLQQIEQAYDREKTAATFEFTAAENDKDRAFARRKLDMIEKQYADQKRGAFMKSLTTLAGAGIGYAATGGIGGAVIGGMVGGEAGGMLNFLM